MDKILISYINDQFIEDEPAGPVGLQDDLLGEGIIDSLGMMKLIRFIEDKFEIKVRPEDMTIENFNSIASIANYIQSRQSN
jgi:acyl carrier protein